MINRLRLGWLPVLLGIAISTASLSSLAAQPFALSYRGPRLGVHGEAHVIAALQLTDVAYRSVHFQPALARAIGIHIDHASDVICDRRASRQLRQAAEDLCDYVEDRDREELIHVARNLNRALEIEHRLHGPVHQLRRPVVTSPPLNFRQPLLDRPAFGLLLQSDALGGVQLGGDGLNGRRVAATAARMLADHLDQQAELREQGENQLYEQNGNVPFAGPGRHAFPQAPMPTDADPDVYLGEADPSYEGPRTPHPASVEEDHGLRLEELPNLDDRDPAPVFEGQNGPVRIPLRSSQR